MRIWKTFSVMVLLAGAAVTPSLANAQQAQNAGEPTRIGVIDIKFIFENHPTMKSKIESVDVRIKAEEESINKRREDILKELEKLRSFREESKEYRDQEEKIASSEADLKLEFVRREKEFAKAKAQILLETYKDVQATVKAYADWNGIAVVMRYSKDEMDVEKPATVSQGVSRDMVYFRDTIDMTNHILEMLKQKAVAGNPAPTRR